MTDDVASPNPEIANFIERYNLFESRSAALIPANKSALFAALKDAEVSKVLVRFDGSGDSGQVEEVTAFGADEIERDLPAIEVELTRLQFGQDEPVVCAQPVADAIETLAYDALAATHGGWENNEGAYGDFTFDVAAEVITLDYNERYETSEQFVHSF
ncbi:DUF6878 family protein [Sphingopyxis sp.]|uniref:DUF6878 family protein n=1 Tax=Sphingopyxis sp. TaxID=1908224 RepID=UPI003D6D6107